MIFLLGIALITPDRIHAQATPIEEQTPTTIPMEPAGRDADFSAAAVSSIFFDQNIYKLLTGTTVSAALTISMSSTTSNGTVEIFGFSSAVPIAPASLEPSGGGTCSFNEPPTGGTVQVFFSSTGAGSCVIHFTISEDGAGFPNGRIIANPQVNFIPLNPVTANVVFVRPLDAGSPTLNIPFGQTYNGTLTASGGTTPYTFSGLSQPAAGEVVLNNAATGAFTFTPAAGQFGSFSFDYQVQDSTDVIQTATGTVTLVIAPPPVEASNGTLDVPYAGQAHGTLLATGGDGTLTFEEAIEPAKGSVIIDPLTGNYTYFANPGATGTDVFTFRATDGSQPPLSDTGTITVTIGPPPLATTDLDLDVAFESSVSDTISSTGGTPPLTFAVDTLPQKGVVTLDSDTGTFIYTAGDGQTGDDNFTVIISDTGTPQQETIATVTITIGPEPLVTDDLDLDVAFEASVDATVSQNGGTLPVTFTISDDPDKGAVDLDSSTGSFTYTAGINQTGTDIFIITLTDSGTPAQETTATVRITIGAPDQLLATTLTLDVEPGQTGTGNLSASVSGGFPPYTFTSGIYPAQGSLVLNPDGSFIYTANGDASGTDSFTYTVTDSEQASVSAAATTDGTVEIVFPAVEPTLTPSMTPESSPTMEPSPSPTMTPGSSPTPADPTATATSSPTSTDVPPTNAPTGEPSATSTAIPASPTSTATAIPQTSSVIVRVETADGSNLPAGLRVCLDEDCRPLDLLAVAHGSSAQFVAMQIASGAEVVFTDVAPGTYTASVRSTAGDVLDLRTVTVMSGEVETAVLVINIGPATATQTVIGEATRTVVTTTPATNGVVTLPNTGTGGGSSSSSMILILSVLALLLSGSLLRGLKRRDPVNS